MLLPGLKRRKPESLHTPVSREADSPSLFIKTSLIQLNTFPRASRPGPDFPQSEACPE